MPVPTSIADLSTTESSNSPATTESPGDGDNYIRAYGAFIATLRDKLDGTAEAANLRMSGSPDVFNGTYGGGGPVANYDDFVVENDANAGISILTPNTSVAGLIFGDNDDNDVAGVVYNHVSNTLSMVSGATTALTLTSTAVSVPAGVTMKLDSEEAGYRKIPTLAYAATAATSAVGKAYIATGNVTINTGWAAGDVLNIYNSTAGDITITQGTVTTMRLAGTSTTGSRTLATRGLATLFFADANTCVVTGAGVS